MMPNTMVTAIDAQIWRRSDPPGRSLGCGLVRGTTIVLLAIGNSFFLQLMRHRQTGQVDGVDEQVDDLDPGERRDDAADSIDQQISPQNRRGGCRTEFDSPQRQ